MPSDDLMTFFLRTLNILCTDYRPAKSFNTLHDWPSFHTPHVPLTICRLYIIPHTTWQTIIPHTTCSTHFLRDYHSTHYMFHSVYKRLPFHTLYERLSFHTLHDRHTKWPTRTICWTLHERQSCHIQTIILHVRDYWSKHYISEP